MKRDENDVPTWLWFVLAYLLAYLLLEAGTDHLSRSRISRLEEQVVELQMFVAKEPK